MVDSNPLAKIALFVETSTKIGRDFLQGVRNFAGTEHSWSLELWNLEVAPEVRGISQTMPDPSKWKGAGVISRAGSGQFKIILGARLPTVFFTLSDRQRSQIDRKDVVEVFVDAASVAEKVLDHLWDRGLRNFAYVGSLNNPDWSKRRERALGRALAQKSSPLHIFPVCAATEHETWSVESRRMIKWLGDLPKPIGVLASNDARGLQVINACRQGGFAVPGEIAVIGTDNDELICTLSDPPLSTIMLATVEAGYRSAQALQALIEKRDPGMRQILIPATQVIARESTATIVASNWQVEKARKFILDNATKMIQVTDVANHVQISRRSLESHFASKVGHSLLKEILKVRLDKVKALLLSSDTSVTEIAKLSGFANSNYMCKVFKKEAGDSPQAFRQKVRKRMP